MLLASRAKPTSFCAPMTIQSWRQNCECIRQHLSLRMCLFLKHSLRLSLSLIIVIIFHYSFPSEYLASFSIPLFLCVSLCVCVQFSRGNASRMRGAQREREPGVYFWVQFLLLINKERERISKRMRWKMRKETKQQEWNKRPKCHKQRSFNALSCNPFSPYFRPVFPSLSSLTSASDKTNDGKGEDLSHQHSFTRSSSNFHSFRRRFAKDDVFKWGEKGGRRSCESKVKIRIIIMIQVSSLVALTTGASSIACVQRCLV